MIDLQMMANQLSRRSHHRLEDWYAILNAAIHDPALTNLTDGEIEGLVEALQSPEQLHWLLGLLRDSFVKMTNEMPFDFLSRHVSASGYTLREWLEAMHVLHGHLSVMAQSSDLSTLVSFVSATVTKAAAPACSPLVERVRSAIATRGSGGQP